MATELHAFPPPPPSHTHTPALFRAYKKQIYLHLVKIKKSQVFLWVRFDSRKTKISFLFLPVSLNLWGWRGRTEGKTGRGGGGCAPGLEEQPIREQDWLGTGVNIRCCCW